MRYATVPKSWVSAVGPCHRPSTSVLAVSKPNQFIPLKVTGLPSVPNSCPFDTESGTCNQHRAARREPAVMCISLCGMVLASQPVHGYERRTTQGATVTIVH